MNSWEPVTHVTESVSRLGGGVAEVVRQVGRVLIARGRCVRVVGSGDKYASDDVEGRLLAHSKFYRVIRFAGVPLTWDLMSAIRVGQPSLIHMHGIWPWWTWRVARYADESGIPYVVAPHGMLDAWARRYQSRSRKSIAERLYVRKVVEGAACVHATSEAEHDQLRTWGYAGPIAVIENGVRWSFPRVCDPPSEFALGRHTLLYLGRVDPKKGVLELVSAWSHLSNVVRSEWQLVIIGWSRYQSYWARVRELADLFDDSEVCLADPRYGTEKWQALGHARGFILPSSSEGLPLSVLEAWSAGLPVLMSSACNLEEGFSLGAAIRCGTTPGSIAAAIETLAAMSSGKRSALGNRGRELVENKYSWETTVDRLVGVYQWLGGSTDQPVTVARL